MQPTEDLMTEHRAIERMLAILEAISGRLEEGEATDARHLEQIIEFLQVFGDRCHHAKEEDLLLPAMEDAGVPREGLIAALIAEHEESRGHVRGIADGLASLRVGDAGASRIVEHAGAYVRLIRAHIAKEDGELYPLADRVLSDPRQEALEEGFERIEHDVIGAGRHEAFHALLDELESAYLQRA